MWRMTIKTNSGKLRTDQARAVWTRFKQYSRAHTSSLIWAFVAGLGVIGAQIASPWPIKIVFDYVLSDKLRPSWMRTALEFLQDPTVVLAVVCGAILAIALLDALLCYVRDVLLATVGQRVVGKIRQDLFAHLQTLPPSVFENRKTGALLMRLTGDIQMLRQMLVNAVIMTGQATLTIAAMIAAMLWLNWQLALLALATTPLIVWASWSISRKIRVATKKQREKESEVAAIAHDVIGAMPIVQAFNREEIEKKRFSRQNRSSMRAGVKTTRLEARLYRTVSLATAASLCLILFFGVRAVLGGVMTAGDLLVFVAYLRSLNKPMRQVAKLTSRIAKATACGQRVAEIFDIRSPVTNRGDARQIGPVEGRIEFQRVVFSYGNGVPAVRDLTLAIVPGERVAIVGRTGAGKSTLMKLLLRFYDPRSGAILIDGVDLRQVTTESLRRQIGWVHQDTILFGMSVADNIALGRPDAERREIRQVARRVRAHSFITSLPDGYNTILGQNGSTLSGGQRQRIALARALLRNPRLLLLDEPASGLDPLTRRVVEEVWLDPNNNATTIVICHRLAEMQRFDRVVFIADGQVRAAGPHADLLRDCQEYAELVAAGSDDAKILKISERPA